MKAEIHLSKGALPFSSIDSVVKLSQRSGFAGIEILPDRKVVKEVRRAVEEFGEQGGKHLKGFKAIDSGHPSWKPDTALELEHGKKASLAQRILRFAVFPEEKESRLAMTRIAQVKNIPFVTHDTSEEWTLDSDGNEFPSLMLEMSGHQTRNFVEVHNWLKDDNHNMAVDARDDQSISWALKQGFANWKAYWEWIGLEKIKTVHLTFIGQKGLIDLKNHQETLAEEQLIWLHQQGWNGFITVEVHPLRLLRLSQGKREELLQGIGSFVDKTLGKGENWS